MIRRWSIAVALIAFGPVATVVVTDHSLFNVGTADGWILIPRTVEDADISWWESHAGDLPHPFNDVALPPPIPMSVENWRKTYGEPLEIVPRRGLTAYSIHAKSPLIRGRAMSSWDQRYGYEVGVALPWVSIKRSIAGPPGFPPPHPSSGGWWWDINWPALLDNSGILFAVLEPLTN